MDLNRAPNPGLALIRAYGDGGFRVGEMRYAGTVLVAASGAQGLALAALDDLDAAHGGAVAALVPRPDVLLIGAGARPTSDPLPESFRFSLRAARVAVEVMATGPACRTYNVLLGEGRRVAALLLPVD